MLPAVNTRKKENQLPPLAMRAAIAPDSFDKEKRTAEIVWTTGAKVLRTNWWSGEQYYEELSLEPGHCRLDRLNNSAPLLNSHSSYELRDVIGVVVPGSAKIEGGKGLSTVQFSQREDVAPYVQDVIDGVIANISVGYRVYKYEKISGGETEIPTYRAIDWEPFEVSCVPIGADDGAGFRSAQDEKTQFNHVEIVTRDGNKEKIMTSKTDAPAAAGTEETRAAAAPSAPAAPAAPAVNESEVRAAAVTAERERANEIRTMVRASKIDKGDELADELIRSGATVDAARKQVFDKLVEAGGTETRTANGSVTIGDHNEIDNYKRGVETALLHRFNPGVNKLDDNGRRFRGMTLLELGRESLELRGVKTRGMSKTEVAQMALGLNVRSGGMHHSTDFPEVLANTAGKTLRRAYELKGQTFRPLGRQVSLPDFKQVSRVQIGEAPQLKKVIEGGEYTRGTMGEGAEKYQLSKYGRILAVTWETLVNDDLDAFTRLPAAFGASAADLESDLFYEVLTANAALSDSVALFHASHGNLSTSGSALSETSLSSVRAKLRKQKAPDAKKFLNLQGKYIVVPPELETTAQKLLATVVPNATSGVNVFAGAFDPIVEPRLTDAAAWYMFADPAVIDTIEYGYLEGEEGPQIEQRVGFEVDGLEIKCRSTFVAKAIDYRGMQKATGAA